MRLIDPKTVTDPHFEDAKPVSDHVLEVTRQAYMNDDFAMFRARFILPQLVGTFTSEDVIETAADLRVLFDNIRSLLANTGVLDMRRHTLEARFMAPDRVQATFVSQYLLPSLTLSDEIFAHGTLRLVDGLWRIEESRYATDLADVTRALSAKV